MGQNSRKSYSEDFKASAVKISGKLRYLRARNANDDLSPESSHSEEPSAHIKCLRSIEYFGCQRFMKAIVLGYFG